MNIVFHALTLCVLALAAHAVSIWPQPTRMKSGNDAILLSPSFKITPPIGWFPDKDFELAINRTMNRIQTQSISPYTTDQGAQKYATATKKDASRCLQELQIRIGPTGVARRDMKPFLSTKKDGPDTAANDSKVPLKYLSTGYLEHMDESYTLEIPNDGSPAVLQVRNALAALRGLSTFSQLVYASPSQSANAFAPSSLYIDGLPLNITDNAAFPYRGIMLDTSRNYLSPATIQRQLDAMELLKLNQFHWHITDTASWPLGLNTGNLSLLAQKGAYGPDKIYTPTVIQDIVTYAMQRGINVVMEIDMPGHQFMGVRDYPGELIVCGDETNWLEWGNEPPTGHLDIRKPGAAKLMKEIFTELTNYTSGVYVSTGNDEVEAQCYGLKKGDKQGMDKLLAPFVNDVHSHLVSLGKTPMVWEEAALDYPNTAKTLKPGTLVEAWTGSSNVEKLLKSNDKLRLIHAPVDYFYLDCGMGDFLGNNPGGASWCTYVTWQQQYSFDPLNGTQSVPGGAERVMGGESALWAELVDEANVESLLWPRAAAGAEVFWTGAKFTLNDKEQKRQAGQALPRLHEARARLRAMDIRSAPLQPYWCALRPGRCDMPKQSSSS